MNNAEHPRPAATRSAPTATAQAAAHLGDIADLIFESSPDCLKLLDLQGRLLRMNRNGRCLMQIEHFGELAGAPWHSLWPAQARNTIEAAMAAARRGETATFQAQCPTAKGETKWWDVTVTGVREDGQAVSRLLAISRDVTATVEALASAQRAREAAEQATRARTRFVANVGDQIRAPLTAALGFTQLLGRAALPPAQAAHVDRVHKALDQILALMNDLLDLTRVESGRLTLNTRDFDLQDVLDRVTGSWADAARAKGLRFEVSTHPGVQRRWFGDPARLCQILLNFSASAMRWTSGGGITLAVTQAERNDDSAVLRFEVTDTGRGLSEKEAAELFADPTQADSVTASSRRGLGLAICKRLAQMMGGDVGVRSEQGLGTRLWFTARLKVGHAEGTAMAEFSEPPAVLRDKRILVVDDEPLGRDVAQQLLQLAGCVVDVAENGRVALERVRAAAYDAVLMDMLMPVMGGVDATRQLRQHAASRQLPVIAMTTQPTDADRAASSHAGANDFIAKPLDTGKLWSVMAYWTSTVRAAVPLTQPAGLGDEFYEPTIPAPLI